MADKKKVNPENPQNFTGIRVSETQKKAAGLPAVIKSVQHVYNEVGIARGTKTMFALNQKGGIDCPGCAWPDPDDERSKLGEYCENGAKAIAEEATSKKLTAEFFKRHSVSSLSQLSDYEIGRKGRLAEPMYLPQGADHYEAITWDKAFEKIAHHLNQQENPNQSIFYTSGRTSNEAAFLYQLFARAYGTNNLPDCSNMCHESSGAALSETLGIGKGSVTLDDFNHAEVIMIMGQNPGTNHPRMLTALEKAKKNGATIITVNPIKEAGLLAFANPQKMSGLLGGKTDLTDHYLQIRLNGDLALLQAINKMLFTREEEYTKQVLDHDFIQKHTEGFEAFQRHLEGLSLDELIRHTGLPKEQIELIAQILSEKSKIIICWAMGLTQHKNAVDTIKEVVNLLLLKGSIGKEGAGTCPVRGHSNVQGDRTMGIHEKPSSKLLDKIEEVFQFEVPRKYGYDTVAAIEAMHEGKANVFFGLGGNFISATPDTLYTAQALQNCDLTVHVSTKLNRSHLIHGKEALILPCLARTDVDLKNGKARFQSVENSMGVVHSTQGKLSPISDDLLSEVEIICRLAQATLHNSSIEWDKYAEDYDFIRDSIEQTIHGFGKYNERVRKDGGFYLPNCARENKFNTSSQKAQFSVSDFRPIELAENEFLMMTIRSHDQFNTTIYGLDDRYRGIYNERRVIMMNPMDIKTLGLSSGDIVDLTNEQFGQHRIAKKFIVVEYNIPRRCTATYFPEANVLVPIQSKADKSHTPVSKSVVIRIGKHAE